MSSCIPRAHCQPRRRPAVPRPAASGVRLTTPVDRRQRQHRRLRQTQHAVGHRAHPRPGRWRGMQADYDQADVPLAREPRRSLRPGRRRPSAASLRTPSRAQRVIRSFSACWLRARRSLSTLGRRVARWTGESQRFDDVGQQQRDVDGRGKRSSDLHLTSATPPRGPRAPAHARPAAACPRGTAAQARWPA